MRRTLSHMCLAVLCMTMLESCTAIRWHGGWPSGEYKFIFTTPDGQPVPGISVEVLGPDGEAAHLFPISNFTSAGSLMTSDDGVVNLIHTNSGYEFGGRCYAFWFAHLGTCEAPRYLVTFVKNGQEVYAIEFGALSSLGRKVSIEQVVFF